MASPERSSRRGILGGCLAAVVAAAPVLVWLGVATAPIASADDTVCGDGLSMDPATMQCLPDVSATGVDTASSDFAPAPEFSAAPSETDLTDSNPGIASPDSHAGR